MIKRFLFVLHEMGTIDHAVALKSQIQHAGGDVKHVAVCENKMPAWADDYFPHSDRLLETDALESLAGFSAVWMAEPYEQLRPVAWREIWERVPLVYSGYGVPLSDWKRGYDFPFFDHCQLIMASSAIEEKEYRDSGVGSRKVALTGDPLMFEVMKLPEILSSKNPVGTILWAPHWTKKWVDGSAGFANWEWAVGALYHFFKSHPDTQLVVRPHPFLTFQDGTYRARTKARRLFSLPNVSRSETSMHADIAKSDLLISDGVSILAYFGATGKPVVVLRNKKYPPPFDAVGEEITASMANITSRRSLGRTLSAVSSDGSPALGGTQSVREAILHNFPVQGSSPGKFLVDNS